MPLCLRSMTHLFLRSLTCSIRLSAPKTLDGLLLIGRTCCCGLSPLLYHPGVVELYYQPMSITNLVMDHPWDKSAGELVCSQDSQRPSPYRAHMLLRAFSVIIPSRSCWALLPADCSHQLGQASPVGRKCRWSPKWRAECTNLGDQLTDEGSHEVSEI